jgi:hypothetical protein
MTMLISQAFSVRKFRVRPFVAWAAAMVLFSFWPDAAVLAAPDDDGHPKVVSSRSKVFGLTYGEWGAAWWQWLLPIPPCSTGPVDPDHPTECAGTPAPTLDTTGAECDAGQSGPVWFLAGTSYNTLQFGAATRSCTVPPRQIHLLSDRQCYRRLAVSES